MMRADVGNMRASEHGERAVDLILNDLEHTQRTRLAANGQSIQCGASEQHGIGAECDGFDDVGSASYSAIEHECASRGTGGFDLR